MRQNAGLLTQHVSSTTMPIFRSTNVSTAFWCPNQKAELTIVLLMMDILVPKTCSQLTSILSHLVGFYLR
jgi:hypothetical protein